jgi:hypothetical protein
MRKLHMNLHLTYFNKARVADIVFLLTVTFGVISLVGGFSIILFTASLPARISGISAVEESVIFVVSQIPGIPLEFGDLISSGGLNAVGVALWIMGFNILLIGLGLWTKSKAAKWIAFGVFSVATFMEFVQFLLLGVLGSPSSVVGIFVNGLIVYMITKLDF